MKLYFFRDYFLFVKMLLHSMVGVNNVFDICRRSELQKELESSHVPEEEQINLIKDLESKETEFMRLKRHKICVEDFDLLTIIGRGAFGEVLIFVCFLWFHNLIIFLIA